MQPTITTLPEKKLMGMHCSMSYANNQTRVLWQQFMPQRKSIRGVVGADLFSLQVFDTPPDSPDFTLHSVFEKWAAVEVTSFDDLPEGMEPFTLVSGLYAVFHHKGAADTGPKSFQYIFGVWLPASPYQLDNRPHFEKLGERYKNDDPDSEEEIWIPVKLRVP